MNTLSAFKFAQHNFSHVFEFAHVKFAELKLRYSLVFEFAHLKVFYIEISKKNKEKKTGKYKIKIDHKTTKTNLKLKCYIKPIFRTVV